MRKLFFYAALAFLSTSVMFAQEEQKNDGFNRWMIRARGVGVIPNESATIGIIGGDAAISSTFIPELDFTYFFTKNIAAELILGTSKHDVNTEGSNITAIGGPARADIDLGSVRLLPPTLTVQYHFYTFDGVFKPYVGAGINYTIFYDVKAGNTVKDVDYDNNVGFALQLGFDVKVSDKFYINADVKQLFLNTDVTVDATNLAPGLKIPAEVDINPLLLGVGVGYSF
ncbi:OmpW family protein [Flavobacterium cyanobacteriorum]|uniref:OmpW family protein n=1 Tax=Flavobacterium cyanobacteriorum TaxID=2022802 RepID=A0A255YSA4_9FLAO|nr:OmpW family outer membrane protein [Flavobacterium cyanobacteriorum]OYQ32071.1 OmpW family protein [Flavobacterium cyanobacteriorum]